VSAKARNINILQSASAIESFIQTDAAVNRGNSGGALVNTLGELVGINAAIASNTGSYEGYSFAIPVNIVKKVINDLLKYGETQRAYLGVVIRQVDASLAKELDLNEVSGDYVNALSEKGAAQEAGIKPGDVIVGINETKINTTTELLENIGQHRPGDLVTVKVIRDGKEKQFTLVLKNEEGTTSVIKREEEFYLEAFDTHFQRIDNDDKSYLRINNGLKINSMGENSVLKISGVREGFIVTRVNGLPVSGKGDIEKALNNSKDRNVSVEGVYPNGMRVIYGFEIE